MTTSAASSRLPAFSGRLAASIAALALLATPAAGQKFKLSTLSVPIYVTVTDTDKRLVPDLVQDDFEVLEDRVAQNIEQFERIAIRGNLPQDLRAEPNSVDGGRQAAQNPRARVFVVFLDIGHVDVGGSHNIRRPLVDALNRLVGPDDLVAVMTPEMSPVTSEVESHTMAASALPMIVSVTYQWPVPLAWMKAPSRK